MEKENNSHDTEFNQENTKYVAVCSYNAINKERTLEDQKKLLKIMDAAFADVDEDEENSNRKG